MMASASPLTVSETRPLANRFDVLADLGDATPTDGGPNGCWVLRFCDNEHDGCQRMAALAGALSHAQTLLTGRVLTVDTMADLISEMATWKSNRSNSTRLDDWNICVLPIVTVLAVRSVCLSFDFSCEGKGIRSDRWSGFIILRTIRTIVTFCCNCGRFGFPDRVTFQNFC